MTQAARYTQRLVSILDAQGSHPDLVMALIAMGEARVRMYEESGEPWAEIIFDDKSMTVISLAAL